MPLPPRRWFQFRLSTFFVLVAILAWAMWLGPGTESKHVPMNFPGAPLDQVGLTLFYGFGNRAHLWEIFVTPTTLFYPALALAAFVGWKAAWAIVERQRKRAEVSQE